MRNSTQKGTPGFLQALREFLIASLNATAMGRVALHDRVMV